MVGQIIDWHVSVQLSLVALYLNLDLDFLVACRTAPNHSWRNPVERLMSIINLGFQSVGLMHSKLSEDFELKIQNCNSLKELRAACESSSNDVAETLKLWGTLQQNADSVYYHLGCVCTEHMPQTTLSPVPWCTYVNKLHTRVKCYADVRQCMCGVYGYGYVYVVVCACACKCVM